MLADVLATIARAEFKRELLRTARELYDIERPFGFDAFERSGRYCFDKLRQAGAEDVELLEFPADGRACYWDKVLPPAWYPQSGRLEITGPAGAFDDPVIADHGRNPFHLAMWSASTPPGGVRTEIVTEAMMLAGQSVSGKLVLAEPHHRVRNIYRVVCQRGGLGMITDWTRDPFVTPDGIHWENSFRQTVGWYPQADDVPLVGFSVSPRVARRLRRLLVTGTVRARAEVHARQGPGKLLAAAGTVAGADLPNEEIWLAAHLYEPLGTDNCTGAAVTLTAARVLKELIGAGELPRPRRTVRFVLTLELYGFTAVLKTLMQRGKRLAATFVLDGPSSQHDGAPNPVQAYLSPAANPLFSDTPTREALKRCLDPSSEIWRLVNPAAGAARPVPVHFRAGYFGNDAFLGDPMVGGPAMHLHCGSGPYWHNSENTFEKISTELLASMLVVHAGLAHYLAGLGPQHAEELTALVVAEGRQYLEQAYRQHGQAHQSPAEIAKALALRLGLVRKRLANLKRWTGAKTARGEQAAADLARELLRKAGAEKIDPDRYEPDRLENADRRALTAIFTRKEPTFPMSQAFVADPGERREPVGGLDNILARMDGRTHLLRIIEQEEYFGGRALNRRRILSDCLFLARHGYLDVRFTEVVTKDDLVAGLRAAGVGEGDLIFAHSSLSAFGHVAGGAETAVDALLEAVGPEGTVLVPTFTRGLLAFDGMLARRYELQPFHPGLRRCWTGAVPEAFLARAAVVRSMHATHSVAGLGPLADACLQDQRLDDPPAGQSSAFARLVEHGGKVVYFGSPVGPSTFLHYLETRLDLPYLTDAVCCVRDDDGRTRLVLVRKHLGGHRGWSRTAEPRKDRVFRTLIDAGLAIGRAAAGLGRIHVIDARQFESIGLDVIRSDPAVLLCDSPDCTFCSYWRQRASKEDWIGHGSQP